MFYLYCRGEVRVRGIDIMFYLYCRGEVRVRGIGIMFYLYCRGEVRVRGIDIMFYLYCPNCLFLFNVVIDLFFIIIIFNWRIILACLLA